MKRTKIVSDYTPLDEPNQLNIIRDSQGDIHLNMVTNSGSERGVRVAVSGTRYSHNVRQALYNLIEALEKEKKL